MQEVQWGLIVLGMKKLSDISFLHFWDFLIPACLGFGFLVWLVFLPFPLPPFFHSPPVLLPLPPFLHLLSLLLPSILIFSLPSSFLFLFSFLPFLHPYCFFTSDISVSKVGKTLTRFSWFWDQDEMICRGLMLLTCCTLRKPKENHPCLLKCLKHNKSLYS